MCENENGLSPINYTKITTKEEAVQAANQISQQAARKTVNEAVEIVDKEKNSSVPFYKDKEFYKTVGTIILNAGIAFGAAYLANLSKRK